MESVLEEALNSLEQYFSRSHFNGALKFSTKYDSRKHWANLSSGNGELLFNTPFDSIDALEYFINQIGEHCSQIGDCLIITHTLHDKNLVSLNWCSSYQSSSEDSDDSMLPDLNVSK